MAKIQNLGVVIIGRNEGDRLRRCLNSVVDKVEHIVYVDSSSTDGSIELAKNLGVHVLELDPAKPFASPRSRDEGFHRLLEIAPNIEYVQFVDGDCVLLDGWLDKAKETLDTRPDVAIVCGRRREQFPDRYLYNRLYDIEWNTPVGEANECGGDSMMRPEAYRQAGGFNHALIGGGEPELCIRIREKGWKILRIDADMTLHDADTKRFGQWWKRTRRCGHAYAQVTWLHRGDSDQHWLRPVLSNLAWGLFLPLIILMTIWPSHGWSVSLLILYPILVIRTSFVVRYRGSNWREVLIYSLFCGVIGKFPMMLGQLQFYLNNLRKRNTVLIEYKDADVQA